MKMPRRPVATIAALAVAWTALWPLVTSAQRVAAGEAMPLCHQAGMQVEPGSAPRDPSSAPGEFKLHCPLCVMAFYAGTAPPVIAPTPPHFAGDLACMAHCADIPAGTETPHPPSHAPPVPS